jgi:hypothetical protein
MVRRIAAGLTGLGLIGGAGAVAYNDDGSAKVTITDKQGRKESVTIGGGGGQSFTCPDGTQAKLEPIDLRAGRVKITLRHVDKRLDAMGKRYPGGKGPHDAVVRYNALVKRNHRLVRAYNAAIDEHNAVLNSDCEPA